ncbi:hexosyltransferase [Candidatus Poribacteria bacterium]|nr:hexosyltransferase [Candidatus Poribacteria bacterium]
MRIAYIAAGAAGMLCGACIHDNTLAAAMQRKGHDVALVPTYTPIRTDERDVSLHRVFYGGVNVYLQQKAAVFRRTPWALDRLLDGRPLLNALSRFSSATSARDLGGLTVSILRGEHGRQSKELAKLVRWLRDEHRPDIVQLTNSMFVGMAGPIKDALGVPVLCALQGEDIFLDDLQEPYRSDAHAELRKRARDVDGFIAPCRYYADAMTDYMDVPADRVHVVPLGIGMRGHSATRAELPDDPFVIAYLARICPEKGLHILIDAVIELLRERGADAATLRVAGYLGTTDMPYFDDCAERMSEAGFAARMQHLGEVDRAAKIDMLASAHVLSVPTVYREPKGLFALEAMANGTPVVVPAHGGFPEMIEQTGGGVLVAPNSPQAVADGIRRLMDDRRLRDSLGGAGQEAVRRDRNDELMADRTLAVYQQYLDPNG